MAKIDSRSNWMTLDNAIFEMTSKWLPAKDIIDPCKKMMLTYRIRYNPKRPDHEPDIIFNANGSLTIKETFDEITEIENKLISYAE